MTLKRWAIAPTVTGFVGVPSVQRYTRRKARKMAKLRSGTRFGEPHFIAVKVR